MSMFTRLDEDYVPLLKNVNHMVFAFEFVLTADPVASYYKAYPGVTIGTAFTSSAALLRRSDVRKFIDDYYVERARQVEGLRGSRAKELVTDVEGILCSLQDIIDGADHKFSAQDKLKAIDMKARYIGVNEENGKQVRSKGSRRRLRG